MKNFLKRKTKELSEAKSDTPQVVFQEAPPDLDIFMTARFNLRNFKEFFEQTQENAFEPYQLVSASLSKAYSNLTQKQAELETEQEHHNKDMDSIQSDIKKQKETFETESKEIENLKQKQEDFSHSIDEYKQKIKTQTSKNATSTEQKAKLAELQEKLKSLRLSIESKQKELETVISNNKTSNEEYLSLKDKLAEKEKYAENELLESEQQVKDLQSQAKKLEQEQEKLEKIKAAQEKSPKKARAPADRKSETFIIQDNLKLGNRELDSLRLLTQQIQQENDQLQAELEDKQMDIDCLGQQNLGLKQILRDMLENHK